MLPADMHIMLSQAIHQLNGLSVSLLNIQGVFLFWNTGAKLLDGYESDEVIGKPLNILHPTIEKKEKLSEYLLSAAGKEGHVKNIGRRIRKDGSIYIASVLFNAILDKTGKLIGYIRIARELRSNEAE